MTARTRKRTQLSLAVVAFLGVGALLWFADSAMTDQYRVLGGCWPQTVLDDGMRVPSSDFWLSRVEGKGDLGPVERFFETRVNHRILFYLIGLCSLFGWSASIFLRILRAKSGEGSGSPGGAPLEPFAWEEFIASLCLALLGGPVVFLLLITSRLVVDPGGDACISIGYAYLAAMGGIACGLLVVRFFDWFEEQAKKIWGRIAT